MMHRSSWTPSIVPSGWDQSVYLVVDCDRHGACVWTEAYVESTDLETVIADLMSGQYSDPQRVVAFNIAEHWAKDVSDDVAREIRRRADLAYEELTSGVGEFVIRHAGRERQLALRLV
jgi:hypothetical protein